MSSLFALREGGFSALDRALVDAFDSIWPDGDADALIFAALSSWAVGQGHSCFTPDLRDEWAAGREPDPIEPAINRLCAAWRDGHVPRAPFIGDAASGCPIVVIGERSWLRRYWRYEREIETALHARATPFASIPDAAEVRAAIDRWIPSDAALGTDWQRVAAASALRAPLTVICGGPGTGKTHTALRVLALIRHFSERPLRMGLAAPTGKAAQRLSESVRRGVEALDLDEAQRSDLPLEAMTLHRLLGFRPQSVEPLRHASDPLELDVLVVDECSMVDLPLMAKLLRALKPDCRLILLGDPDQLPAVENGAVLATLAECNHGNAVDAATAAWLEAASGHEIATHAEHPGIGDRVIRLERPRRFGGDSGIARLVRAIREGDSEMVFAALANSDDIHWSAEPWQPGDAENRRQLRERHRALIRAPTPGEALAALGQYRILCALREGPCGVAGLNQAVSNALPGNPSLETPVAGRPILVTSNQPALGIFNGDVGVLLGASPGSALRAWFARADGSLQGLLPAQLPPHEPAYAMTVHKAQGSEFDVVELVLPPEPHPLLTREWLYTAASRARCELRIHASREVIRAALGQRTRRVNGLQFS